MRKTQIADGEYYHIFNRGTDKRKIFLDDSDYERFLLSMKLMNFEEDGMMQRWRDYKENNPSSDLEDFLATPRLNLGVPQRFSLGKKLVGICCYSLLPNHFHFIVRQLSEKGIEKIMQRIGTGYTMYFNKRYDRTGSLFQGTFKAAKMNSGNFLYLSAYVNCNAEVHGIARAEDWKWSSYSEYLGRAGRGLCDKKAVMEEFRSGEDYRKFAKENVRAARQMKSDEKIVFE